MSAHRRQRRLSRVSANGRAIHMTMHRQRRWLVRSIDRWIHFCIFSIRLVLEMTITNPILLFFFYLFSSPRTSLPTRQAWEVADHIDPTVMTSTQPVCRRTTNASTSRSTCRRWLHRSIVKSRWTRPTVHSPKRPVPRHPTIHRSTISGATRNSSNAKLHYRPLAQWARRIPIVSVRPHHHPQRIHNSPRSHWIWCRAPAVMPKPCHRQVAVCRTPAAYVTPVWTPRTCPKPPCWGSYFSHKPRQPTQLQPVQWHPVICRRLPSCPTAIRLSTPHNQCRLLTKNFKITN